MSRIKHYKLSEIPSDFKVRNDMIDSLNVCMFWDSFLSLELCYKSKVQSVGCGYCNQTNIGLMICELAKLLERTSDNCHDILFRIANTPIRVAFKNDWGGSVAESTYIGNFMKDDFILYHDLINCGIREN